jgi:hypothetical protein
MLEEPEVKRALERHRNRYVIKTYVRKIEWHVGRARRKETTRKT